MKAVEIPDIGDVVGATNGARAWLDEAQVRQRAGTSLGSGLIRELWKYTPIKGFLEGLADAPANRRATLVGVDQPGIRVSRLGALSPDDQGRMRRWVADRLDPERYPLADLALLRAEDGWLVEVTADIPEPVEIRLPAGGIVPVFLVLAPNARVTFVEEVRAQTFLAQVLHAELGVGARLRHDRAALDKGVPHYFLESVRLDRDAHYTLNQSCTGGERRRGEVRVVLDAPGGQVDMTGAYLVEDRQHLDQQLLVEHRAGRTTSRQKFHGIGAGKGRSVFNGRIHIHPHAPGSDANLSNRNLALSPDAEMNTKPELEIYTDDVRCGHGATVGQLSAEALFYLTARGISETDARRLLSHGFLRECLSGALAHVSAERFKEALT